MKKMRTNDIEENLLHTKETIEKIQIAIALFVGIGLLVFLITEFYLHWTTSKSINDNGVYCIAMVVGEEKIICRSVTREIKYELDGKTHSCNVSIDWNTSFRTGDLILIKVDSLNAENIRLIRDDYKHPIFIQSLPDSSYYLRPNSNNSNYISE